MRGAVPSQRSRSVSMLDLPSPPFRAYLVRLCLAPEAASEAVTTSRLVVHSPCGSMRTSNVIPCSSSVAATVDEHGMTFDVRIEPQGEWTTSLDVVTASLAASGARQSRTRYARNGGEGRSSMETDLERWLGTAPRIECSWDPLEVTYRRSLVDLAALRFSPPISGGKSLPAAGLPWFMTMFGRDSIFTSLQALPFKPELAATTIHTLGSWQGTRVDDFRDEDPGRILHELRYGELTAFEERPHSPYFGSADATPLYVVLL